MQASHAERAELITNFGDALRDVGFIGLKLDDIFASLVAEVNEEMRRYFGQDLETKKKDIHGNYGQTGFAPYDNETATAAEGVDLKETWFVSRALTNGLKGSLKNIMSRYHARMTEIAGEVMAMFLEYVQEDSSEVRSEVASAQGNLVRLAHYFAPQPGDDPKAVWAAEHTDLNALTLLPPSTPGLQLRNKEDEWVSVVVPEGYLIVNTGDQVEQLTGGLH